MHTYRESKNKRREPTHAITNAHERGRKEKGCRVWPRDAKLFFFLCPFLIPRDEWEWKERTRPVRGADVMEKKSSAHLRNMFCRDVVGYSGKKRMDFVDEVRECVWLVSRVVFWSLISRVCLWSCIAILWKVCSGWNYMFLLSSAIWKTKSISKFNFRNKS